MLFTEELMGLKGMMNRPSFALGRISWSSEVMLMKTMER